MIKIGINEGNIRAGSGVENSSGISADTQFGGITPGWQSGRTSTCR